MTFYLGSSPVFNKVTEMQNTYMEKKAKLKLWYFFKRMEHPIVSLGGACTTVGCAYTFVSINHHLLVLLYLPFCVEWYFEPSSSAHCMVEQGGDGWHFQILNRQREREKKKATQTKGGTPQTTIQPNNPITNKTKNNVFTKIYTYID